MAWPASPFVGRERELTAVEELLERAGSRHTVVLDVTGEPGIGKTRLLREALDAARRRRFATRMAQASELEHDAPYGVLAAAFARPADEERRRHQVARDAAAAVEALAFQAPLAVAVDDVHWADPASIGVLAHLVDRVSGVPLLLAFTWRRGPRPAALEAAVERAERDGRAARLELAPLSDDDAAALIGAGVEAPLRDALMRESGGNPFYLEQLARAAAREPGAGITEPLVAGVPRAVAASLAAELAELPEVARRVAHALAVAGDDADPDLVAAVADLPREETLAALDVLVAADVARPRPDAPAFTFRHPIVRRAVHDSAPPGWRIDAHRRAASALRERGAPIARRAHYEEQAAAPGDREAVELLAGAARECLTVAPATAARWYRAALRLLPGDEAQGDAGLALRMPLALALATAGAVEDSRDALRDLLAALPEQDEPQRATIVTAMAAIEHLLGRYDEARELLVRELAGLGPQRQGERAAIAQSLADNHYFGGDWAAMRDAATDAAALAAQADAPALAIEASAAASIAHGALGDRESSDAALADARAGFDTVSDRLLVAHLDAPFWLGLAELHLEDYAGARRVFERGIELSRKTGQESAAVQLGVGQASVCALTGRLAEGRRAAAFAVDVARLMGVPNLLGWAEIARCWIALREGRLDESLEAGAYVERTVAELGVPAFSGGLCALAEARVLVGDACEGRDALLVAAGGDDLSRVNPLLRTWAYEVLTLAEVALDDPRRAQSWAERAATSAAVLGLGRDRASALLARARVALARDELEEATESALASADVAQACGALPQAIRARIVAGVARDRAGDRDRAADLIGAAHREARTCGALGDRNEAEQALRALGRRPRGRSAATAGSHLLSTLTERERDVAELVADRLRNREIAARLHLSEKTVERHVSGILRKLGVDSRVDVARAVDSERASR